MYQNKSWARNSTRLPLKPAYHGHISCNSREPVMVFVCFCLVAIDSRSSRSLKGFARLLQRFASNIPAHEIWWQQRYAPSYSVARKCKRSPLPLQICNDVTRMVIRQRCRPTSPDSSHVYCKCSSSMMVLPAERAHCMPRSHWNGFIFHAISIYFMSIQAFCTIDEKCWDDRDVPAWSTDSASISAILTTVYASELKQDRLDHFGSIRCPSSTCVAKWAIPGSYQLVGLLCLSRSLRHALAINL